MSADAALDIARSLFAQLEQAWNAADGPAFAAPFAGDADFVDIRGTHHATRAAIAAGHQGIFESIYEASTVSYRVTKARFLGQDCVVMHARGALTVPHGPVAGTHDATMTAVATPVDGGWQIAAFQNTPVAA
jgi:uncharacterized protein (TIGR02246 family)